MKIGAKVIDANGNVMNLCDSIVGSMSSRFSKEIDEILKRELRMLGFKGECVGEDIKRFMEENGIDLVMDESPMLTTYKAVRRTSNITLFEFIVKTSVIKEVDRWVCKTEFLKVVGSIKED